MAFERSKPRKSPSIMALGDFRRLKVPINSFEEAILLRRPKFMQDAIELCGSRRHIAGDPPRRESEVFQRLSYEKSSDFSRCAVELRWRPDGDLFGKDQPWMREVTVLRGKYLKDTRLRVQIVSIIVPESDWPLIGDLVRESASSFEVDWVRHNQERAESKAPKRRRKKSVVKTD
jgi:hypothetical protein